MNMRKMLFFSGNRRKMLAVWALVHLLFFSSIVKHLIRIWGPKYLGTCAGAHLAPVDVRVRPCWGKPLPLKSEQVNSSMWQCHEAAISPCPLDCEAVTGACVAGKARRTRDGRAGLELSLVEL